MSSTEPANRLWEGLDNEPITLISSGNSNIQFGNSNIQFVNSNIQFVNSAIQTFNLAIQTFFGVWVREKTPGLRFRTTKTKTLR